jgi:hypothetical protein
VGDEIDDVQARDALLMQVVHGMRVLFAKNGYQHVGTGYLLLAIGGGLHMHDCALDDALKAQRGLGVDFFVARHHRGVFPDEIAQVLAKIVNVCSAGPQHFGRRRVVQQGQEQMLDRDELMTLLTGLDKGHVQADFQLLSDHASSITHCRGC